MGHWLQNLFQLSFGFRNGDGNSPAYLFWSGAGSDLGELAIVVGLAGIYRRHNCQIKGCWRIGHHKFTEPGTGTERCLCWRHHPDVKSRQLTKERLHLYLGKQPGKG